MRHSGHLYATRKRPNKLHRDRTQSHLFFSPSVLFFVLSVHRSHFVSLAKLVLFFQLAFLSSCLFIAFLSSASRSLFFLKLFIHLFRLLLFVFDSCFVVPRNFGFGSRSFIFLYSTVLLVLQSLTLNSLVADAVILHFCTVRSSAFAKGDVGLLRKGHPTRSDMSTSS